MKSIFIMKSMEIYTNSIERGKLKVPCQWLFFYFIFFNTINKKESYKSLSNILGLFLSIIFFKIERKHVHIFENIVLKNFCRSDNESALKVLQLS